MQKVVNCERDRKRIEESGRESTKEGLQQTVVSHVKEVFFLKESPIKRILSINEKDLMIQSSNIFST